MCGRDPIANVFVAARILQTGLTSNRIGRGTLLSEGSGSSQMLCWAGVNVVPVQADPDRVGVFAQEVSRRRRQVSSLFGPAEATLALWERLHPDWGNAREVRADQPVMTMTELPSRRGVLLDSAVRTAAPDEVDLVLPAATAMFTEEIGYPPYYGSDRLYRQGVAHLIAAGHTLVRIQDGQVVFKADLGSVAGGVAQIQGVWLHPDLRGQGLAVPAMAAAVEYTLRSVASAVTLYVNAFNAPALATYRRVGFTQTGTFATVLL